MVQFNFEVYQLNYKLKPYFISPKAVNNIRKLEALVVNLNKILVQR